MATFNQSGSFMTRNFFSIKNVALFIFTGFLFFGMAAQAHAATYYVDRNIVQDFCAGGYGTYIIAARTCGGSGGPIAYKTISAAIINSSQGDIIYVREGTYAEVKANLTPAIGTGEGLTVTPYNSEAVVIDPASYTSYLWQVNSSTTNITFDGGPNRTLTFNNTLATAAPFFHIPSGNVTITRSIITDPAARVSDGWIHLDQGYAGGTLTLSRNLIHDMGGVLIFDGAGSGAFTINITSNKMDAVKQILGAYGTGATLNETNNTVVRATSTLHTVGENLAVNSTNNIFVLKTDGATNRLFTISAGKSPRSWNFKNNIVWREAITSYADYSSIIYGQYTHSMFDKSNRFVNPNFTAYGTGYSDADLTLQNIATNYATGRGLNVYLPSGGDFAGTAWPANDNSVGCHINPTLSPKAYPTLDAGKFAFSGDSIMYGANGSDNAHTAWGRFSTISGLTPVNNAGIANDLAAISGQSIGGASFLIDRTIFEAAPETVFISIGINDLAGTPSVSDNADRVLGVKVIIDKLIEAGITPIWLGVESKIGNPPDNSVPLDFNSKMLTECVSYGMSCGAILSQMMVNANWKTDYYSNLITDVHPNDAGHLLIAKLAEYLYYTKFTMGTDKIDSTGNVRIFNDGKYRYTTTTSGTLNADLTIQPTGGFVSDDKSELMNISSITWSNTDTDYKSWTESSDNATLTNTIHTIGDLAPNRSYNVLVDGVVGSNITGASCTSGSCQSNSSGKITFTYAGTYSPHLFEVVSVRGGVGRSPVTVNSPSIYIRIPANGAVYAASSIVGFDWASADGAFAKYNLSYSADAGNNWTTVINDTASTSLSWVVPDASTTQGKIKVEGYDSSGNLLASATSTGNFTIHGTVPVANLTPTSPEVPTPVTDTTATGAYSPLAAFANTPDIATDKGLSVSDANTTVYCDADSLIKGSFPAVYYCGADGKRYVFANSRVYFTWYGDFSTVKIISDDDMAKIPLGGNVTYRPGVKMVKAESDPKVYAVSRGGLLRWVSSEVVARQLYGNDWNKMIDYVSDAFWTNYRLGLPI